MVVLTSLWARCSCMVRIRLHASVLSDLSIRSSGGFSAESATAIWVPCCLKDILSQGHWEAYGSESFVQIFLENFSDFLNLFSGLPWPTICVWFRTLFLESFFWIAIQNLLFYFEREFYFSQKKDCSKKTALSDYFLRILIDKLGPYMCYVFFILSSFWETGSRE